MNKQLATQHKGWVLETVDLIRMRKARPSLERISRILYRTYGLSVTETKESLEELVKDGKINRVHFKGNVSFRRCNSLPDKQSPENNAQSTSNRIIHAVKLITKQTGDGVTFDELQQWLISRNPDTRLVKHRLLNALRREIEANNITQLSDDTFVLTESLPNPGTSKELKVKPIQSIAIHREKHTKQRNRTDEAATNSQSAQNEEEKKGETGSPKRGRPLSKRKVNYLVKVIFLK